MDQNAPKINPDEVNAPNPSLETDKFSIKSFTNTRAGIGLIVATLILLIVITLNFFNFLPFSLPFIPHQSKLNTGEITQNKKDISEIPESKPISNPKCKGLPNNIRIPAIESKSKAPSPLNLYLGIWSGTWSNSTESAALIISSINSNDAKIKLYYEGYESPKQTTLLVKNYMLTSPYDKFFLWQLKGDTLHGYFFSSTGKHDRTISMKKCKL